MTAQGSQREPFAGLTLSLIHIFVLQKNILFSGTIKENLRWGNKNATDEELKAVSYTHLF